MAVSNRFVQVRQIREDSNDPKKVRSLVTDRTKANKISWQKLKEHGVEGGADAVHVHNSMVGDVLQANAFRKCIENVWETYWKRFHNFEGGVAAAVGIP